MNKALQSILFLLALVSMANAQSFTIEPVPAEATADLQDPTSYPGDVVAHAEVVNLTAETLTLSWVREEQVMPDGWASGVCDLNYCYGIEVSRREFELGPNARGTLDVHAYPGGLPGSLENGANPGEARINIRVTDKNNTQDTMSGLFLFNVTGDPILTSTRDLEKELDNLALFPNPTTDFFELSSNKENAIETLAVHNILGRQVLRFEAEANRFDVSDLPKGMYLVSVMDEQEAILKTLRLQKR